MRLLADDLPGEALKLLARPEAEIVFQVAPRPLVDLECLDVTTRAIERDHELRDEPLAIRRFLDQPAQLSHELPMAAKSQIRVDADLERPRAKLVQTLGLRAALQVQRHVRENRAVPEAECLLRAGRGTRVVTGGQRLGCLVYEIFEDLRVENGPTEVDPVAAPRRSTATPYGERARRSRDTYDSRLCAAEAGGSSPQTSSNRRSTGTTSSLRSSRAARTARCLPPPSSSVRSPTSASSSPRMRNRRGSDSPVSSS